MASDGPVLSGIPFRVRIGLAAIPLRPEAIEAIAAAARDGVSRAIRTLVTGSRGPGRPTDHSPIRCVVMSRQSSADEELLASALVDGTGGTLETIATGGLQQLADRLDLVVRVEAPVEGAPEDPLVVLARRRGRPVVTLLPFSVEPGAGLNVAAYERLGRFNTTVVSRHAVEREVEALWADAFDTDEGRRLPPATLAAVRDHLAIPWARADLLARRYQATYRRAGQAVWWLFPIAVAAGALGGLYPSLGVVAFPAQAGLLLVMLLVVWRADRTRSLERWVEHRLLAERLRVTAFLRAAGFEAGPFEPPPHLGRSGRSAWITVVLDELGARMPSAAALPRGDTDAVRTFVARRWVGAQRAFHADRAARHLRWSRALERAGHLVFLLAILIALGHTILALGWAHAVALEHPLLFLGLVLPGAGAALGGFRAHREYSRIARRSAAMAGALAGLEERLTRPEPGQPLEEQLRQVEQVLLTEVQDWVVLMRVAVVQPVG